MMPGGSVERTTALQGTFTPAGCRILNTLQLLIKLFSVSPRSEEDSEGNRDMCSEILQMKALERLTSTVSVCIGI